MAFDDKRRFDVYEKPYASGQEQYSESGSDALKSLLPKIIVLIIIAAVGYFAYYYLIGSVKEVAFSFADTEGGKIAGKVTVYDSSKNEAYNSTSGKPASLRIGTYEYTADAPGYKQKSESIDVKEGSTSFKVVLEKNLNVKISDTELPADASLSGTIVGIVTLQNTGSATSDIELVFEKDLNDFIIEVIPPTIMVPAGETVSVTINASPKPDLKVKNSKGDVKSGSIRIKYTKEKRDVSFKLYEKTEIKLNDVDFSARFNETKEEDISIYNKNKFDINNVVLSAQILDSSTNDKAEVLKWLSFPQGNSIASIKAGETGKIPIKMTVPLNAKKDDISGSIIAKIPTLPDTMAELKIDITDEAEIELKVTFGSTHNIIVKWDANAEKFKTYSASKIKLENDGDTNLTSVYISVKNDSECSESWLKITNQNVGELKKGAEFEVPLSISAPFSAYGKDESVFCIFEVSYANPFDAAGPPLKTEAEEQLQVTADLE